MGEGSFHRLRDRMRGRLGESASPDEICLKYHDISLTNEDVSTLKNDWLTDNVIAFWEEYLEREVISQYKTTNIILLRPSMSYLLYQTPDPRSLQDALPDFSKASHIFLPINDCRSVTEAEGGTHWSLLLVSVVDNVAFHYDSLPPGNRHEALRVAQKVSIILDRGFRFVQLDDSPVQENSSDCGVFVCLTMRHLLINRLLKACTSQKVSMSLGGKKVNASAGRREMLRIIDRLRKKKDKDASNTSTGYSSSGSTINKIPYVPTFAFFLILFAAILLAALPHFVLSPDFPKMNLYLHSLYQQNVLPYWHHALEQGRQYQVVAKADFGRFRDDWENLGRHLLRTLRNRFQSYR